jgi:transposase-like protein
MNQKRVYKSYPQSFKEEAVSLVTDQGYSVPEAALCNAISSVDVVAFHQLWQEAWMTLLEERAF